MVPKADPSPRNLCGLPASGMGNSWENISLTRFPDFSTMSAFLPVDTYSLSEERK
jgi:hypothetical protein